MTANHQAFYNRAFSQSNYAAAIRAEDHSSYPALCAFIKQYRLADKACLEVGAGRGAFQDLVTQYTGTDVSESVRRYFHKPFFRASADQLPFGDNIFDAVWSVAALEHVPEPEKALIEIRRVIKDGGLLYLAPAWQCRSWAARGYAVRPYRELSVHEKLIKVLIPVRESIAFRALSIFPTRLVHSLQYRMQRRPTRFWYRELEPNYDQYWGPDSDAVNSMDPFEAILWFRSRGDKCLSHRGSLRELFVRTGALIFEIRKTSP